MVPFVTVAQGTMSGIDEPREVIARTAAEWQAIWKQHDPTAPLPAVDFTQSMIVGIFLGSRATAGFAVEITTVTTANGRTVVEYRERRPGSDAFVAQVLTSPFHAVRIAHTAQPVQFSRVSP